MQAGDTKTFFKDSITRIIEEKPSILDIGGSLRIDKERSNRLEPKNLWIREAIKEKWRDYRILDYVDTYNPDIVGDIQDLPLPDNSEEALVCIAVLEHVPNPFAAVAEMYRVLKPGGYCFIYVPFLYYYHAENGYYGDYWRFTEEAIRFLAKDFSSVEIHTTRGAIETLIHLSPLGRSKLFCRIGSWLDNLTGKDTSKQTSGFNAFLVK